MNSFFTNIINKGYDKDDLFNSDKSIVITNFILLLATTLAFLRFTLFISGQDFSFALVSLASSIAFFSLYLLNSNGYSDISKFSLLIVGNIATGYKELLSGGTAGQIYLILASFGVVFLLFDIKQTKKLYFALSIPLINTLVNVIFPNLIHEPLLVGVKEALFEKSVGVFSNIFITVLIIWYFVKKSNEIEIKLKDSNKQLNVINDDLLIQKDIIQSKNEEIYASIRYAQRIQNTILPWESTLEETFKEHFVIYKPKDIVSGDFYWLQKHNNAIYFAVGDCTGHGISGSMLTMIGATILEEAVSNKELNSTSEILNFIDYKLTAALNQQLEENKIRDSIEIALIKIEDSKLEFSGARLGLYLYNNGEYIHIKGSRNSIGGNSKEGNDYLNYNTILNNESIIYLFSDGFSDQIGTNKKKFGSNNLKSILKDVTKLSLLKQKEKLVEEFAKHIGNETQRDDITLIGLKTRTSQ
ncbi:MAG: SpoIIE family protein phosphatase [Candidatus Kapabacteria bacterium]|nr:SpoIIE family protein phosphatase [Candidatus Kapabacteria bacterium]